ncbi:hypothetical protein [Ohtaekwangia sp.]|uniref:hypothetical protein n=1 Tax=Ohtaekwangia sp. TaxID=2066019 RepID=UPI002FDD12D6
MAVIILLTIHTLLWVYFIITPRSYPLHQSKVAKVYERLFLIGPFFKEERIGVSPDLYIRCKSDTTWSPYTNYGMNFMHAYYAASWRYNQLQQNTLLRHFTRMAYRTTGKDITAALPSAAFCRLNTFIQKELVAAKAVDSIQLVYIFHAYAKEQQTFKTDTVWNVTFNPHTVCASR